MELEAYVPGYCIVLSPKFWRSDVFALTFWHRNVHQRRSRAVRILKVLMGKIQVLQKCFKGVKSYVVQIYHGISEFFFNCT